MCFLTTYSIHIFNLHFSTSLLSISYLLHVFYSYVSFIHVTMHHFYCLLWALHSSFSLTSFFVFFFAHAFSLLSCSHWSIFPLFHILSHHILSAANLAFRVFLPFTPSLTHSSIMRTLCLMHTHHLLHICLLQHTYRLRHIHCSMHASSWMFFTLCEPVTQLTFFLSFIPDISSTLVLQSTFVSFHHCSGLSLELLALCTLVLDAHLLHDANLPVYHTSHLLHPCSRLLWTLVAYAPMSFTHTCCFL